MYKPQVFGKYLLIDKISQGGMGEVYKAKSFGLQGFEKLFAIKRILPKFSSAKTFVDMLVDEAKIIVSLTHSNIAQVFEFDKIDDTYYLAMEFIHGKDLRTIIESVDSLPIEIACYMVAELTRGLHYLHTVTDATGKNLNIVHRDISPRNIIVSFEGEVKIIDFGIANASNRAFPIGNDIFVGKYAYMSPEQLLGKDITYKSDIFSAGIVLYELLFKKLPLGKMKDRHLLEIDRAHTDVDPKLDKRLLKTLPEELSKIVSRATAIDPNARYEDALALYNDIMGFLANYNKRADSITLGHYIKTIFSQEIYGVARREITEVITEQKKVVVIQVELKSSAEDIETREKILSCFQEILEIIQTHGGILYRLHNQKLIAIFGLPKNREDDIYQALTAALTIKNHRAHLDFDTELTIALDYGSVLVALKGEDLKNFTISEGPFQKVQTLIRLAFPQEILLGAVIQNTMHDHFKITPIERDGNSYYSLIDTLDTLKTSRYGINVEEGFVNRQKEFALYEKALDLLSLEVGKTISIVGEAGIGKTAMAREIARQGDKAKIQIFIESTHPSIKSPYGMFKDLLIQLLSIESNDHENVSLKMAELQGFGLSNVELESLKTILSVRFRSPQLEALSPEQQKLVIFVSLRKIIMGLARQKTIIVFEDLHFADELSLEAIDMILALGPIPNCILIKTYRPHFSYAWKNKDPQEVVIDLPPFTEDTLAAYMKTFTYNIPLSKKVLARIYTQSMGNPLFAGELMKSFLDTKKVHIVNNEYAFAGESSNLVIPDTLYSLLASRVDSLDSKTKATLKEASIIGQEFSFDELKSLSHLDGVALKHALNELLASGIIRDYRKAGQHIYEIIHALMREVVYKSMPHRERSKLHTIIADYLYEKHTNALDEYTQELAYHYKRSTKEDKAFQFLLRAGDETYKSSLISQANLYYIEAIACLTNNENIVSNKNIILIELNYKVGITNQLLGKIDISQKALSRALKFSHDHGINEFIPKIYHQIARVNKIKGDYQEALHSIDEALGLAENIVNPNDQLEFLHEKAALYRIIHEKEKALAILKDGLVQVRVLKDSRLESMYLNALGIMYATSEYTKALEYYRDALLIRKKRKDTLGIAVVLSNVSAACYRLGRLDKAIEYAKKSLHLSSEIEDKLGIALNFANLGEIYLAQHDQDQASDSFLKAFKAAGELSWKEGITISKIHLALIAIFKNENLSHAKQFLEESIEAALGLNNHELIAKAYLVHSKLLSLQKDEETSQYFFAEAQNIIKKNNLFSIIEQFNKILS